MMMGVAQVIGIKPIFTDCFSRLPTCAKASFAMPSGKNVEIADSAVPAPTARRKRRRSSSCGNSARITADSTTRACSASLPLANWSVSTAASCSACVVCRPQPQPRDNLIFGS